MYTAAQPFSQEKSLGNLDRSRRANSLKDVYINLRRETDGDFAKGVLDHLEGSCYPPLNVEHYQEGQDMRFSKVLKKLPLSPSEYASLENLMRFAIVIEVIRKKLKENAKEFLLHGCKNIIDIFKQLRLTLQNWLTKMIRWSSRISEQQCQEFQQDVNRLQTMVKICR